MGCSVGSRSISPQGLHHRESEVLHCQGGGHLQVPPPPCSSSSTHSHLLLHLEPSPPLPPPPPPSPPLLSRCCRMLSSRATQTPASIAMETSASVRKRSLVRVALPSLGRQVYQVGSFYREKKLDLVFWKAFPSREDFSRMHTAHLGSPPRERRVHFEVCFTAAFSGKIVISSMNEVYHTGATREAAYSHCTMVNYSRKRVTQNPRPSEA